jgi:hypothetical protein
MGSFDAYEDVLETYEKPYDPAEPVVCLDEKPVTLHADIRSASAAKPGREARSDVRVGPGTAVCFGWLKTIALMRKVRHRGIEKVGWIFTFAAAAYNLVRMRNLLALSVGAA